MGKISIYTKPITDEAQNRGINVRMFEDISGSYAILEYNGHTEYISQSVTSLINYPLFKLIINKYIANILLKEKGYPVPENILTLDSNEARKFLEKYKKVVVKPVSSDGGKGITPGIVDVDKLQSAFEFALKYTDKNGKILVQEHLEGNDHRVLVIDKKHVFGVKRMPASVIGDGVSSVEELINTWNLTVHRNRQIKIDERLSKFLFNQELQLSSVIEKNRQVLLSNLANSHQGGLSYDVTDILSDEVKEISINIAVDFNLPVVGIDFISEDITKYPGKIVELNPHPGITIHRGPTYGEPRKVEKFIVDMLFPETIV